MVSLTRVFLLTISTLVASAREFSPSALHKLEERLLPALNTFISEREEHLKHIKDALDRTSVLKTLFGDEIGEYLGNPLNQFHVVKRFVDDWGRLEEYLNSDGSIDRKFKVLLPSSPYAVLLVRGFWILFSLFFQNRVDLLYKSQ